MISDPISPAKLKLYFFLLFVVLGLLFDFVLFPGVAGYGLSIMFPVIGIYLVAFMAWLEHSKEPIEVHPLEYASPLYGRLVALMAWPIFILNVMVPMFIADFIKGYGVLDWSENYTGI